MTAQKNVVVFLVVATMLFSLAIAATAAIEVLDASYRPDRILPEFNIFWDGGYRWGDAYGTPTASGALAIYVRNAGTSSVTVSDVTINGAGLVAGMIYGASSRCAMRTCSSATNTTLKAAGEPVWWRSDPDTISAGGTAEIFVRMRARVATTLTVVVQTSAGNASASIVVDNSVRPRVAGYGLSPDYRTLYLYLRHPVSGTVPTQILVDGVDRTSSCVIGGDSDYDLVAVKCTLPSAFTRGSFHSFQAVYDDGTKASDGLRVFYDDFKYGRWGGPPYDTEADDRFHLIDMGNHSMNLQKGGSAGDYSKTPAGLAIMDQYGIKKLYEYADADRLYSIFLCDEPDAGEPQVGAISQNLVTVNQSFKTASSQFPTNLNLDGSFKPYNYYTYGHVPDILSVDPYYQTRLVDAYWGSPHSIPAYSKATYISAVASTCQASCEPSPLHIILNSCRKHDNDNVNNIHRVFRWGTPEEKRIEVYYSLAAGAKQIMYWWFSVVGINADGFNGIGDANEPGSAALWREMGLLGAEAGIASQVIVNSCPVSVNITKPGKLWARALLSGVDTLMLLCVNDDYSNDEAGTIVRSIKNAEVSLELPSWVSSLSSVFEVDYKGIHDVSYDVTGSKVNLHLGRVEVTRMILITKDSTLKSTLQARYASIYAPRVAQLIPIQ